MIPLLKFKTVALRSLPLLRHVSNAVHEDFVFNSAYTEQEQAKVLEILNSCTADELTRFRISQSRIKNLESWKNKRGPFRTMSDILEVDGLGTDILEKICDNILSENDLVVQVKGKGNRVKKQFIFPILSPKEIKAVTNTVGIHLGPTGVSWARIQRTDNYVTDWNYHSFGELPKKILPVDTFNLAVKIVDAIPTANAYVFESVNGMLQGSKSTQGVSSYTQMLELTSMLLALINTNSRHNRVDPSNPDCSNKVYYLRNSLPARLFGTLVGGERVSTSDTIAKLRTGDDSLPCTKVMFDNEAFGNYQKVAKSARDLLGQALLLTVSFMDLVIYENPNSLKSLQRVRK